MASKLKPPRKKPAPKKKPRANQMQWNRTMFRAVRDLQRRVGKLERDDRTITGFSTCVEGPETDSPPDLEEMDDFIG